MSIALFNEPASHTELSAALLARLNDPQFAANAFTRDKAPLVGGDYVLLDVLRTSGGNRRLGGGIAPSSWYATCTAIGSTVHNSSFYLRRSTLALVGFEVTVDAVRSTPIDFDGSLESPVEQDEYDRSLWTGSRTFTFAF